MSRVLAILTGLLLLACAKPPQDVPQAQVSPAAPPAGEGRRDGPRPGGGGRGGAGAAAPAPRELSLELRDGEVAIDTAASRFEFEGYGPGKSHPGEFHNLAGALAFADGKLVSARGVIDAGSVDTGIGRLDNHLRTADFFDIATYPEITMESTRIEQDGESATITGQLTFHGVTHEVSFPATVKDQTVSADFRLDTSVFGMSYRGVDKEVRIQLSLTAE